MRSESKKNVMRLIKAVVPAGARSALNRMAGRERFRGRPFPYVVSGPRFGAALNCCIAYNKHGAYCVPVSGLHRPAVQYVLAGDVWEAPTLDFMASRCKGGDVVHAGTFFGDFLPALASASDRDAKVWAFEPNPESYRCAAITIQLNGLRNVQLVNAGLGEKQGSQFLVTHDDGGTALGGASRMAPMHAEEQGASNNGTVWVQMVSIDDVVPDDRAVSIIQLDVEGYEERALAGGLQTIRRCRPILILETVPGDGWISEHLRPLGYRITERVSDNAILLCD